MHYALCMGVSKGSRALKWIHGKVLLCIQCHGMIALLSIFYNISYFSVKEPVSCWRRKCLIKLNLQYLRRSRSPSTETRTAPRTGRPGWRGLRHRPASPIFVGLALGQIPDKPLKLSDLNILNVMFPFCKKSVQNDQNLLRWLHATTINYLRTAKTQKCFFNRL